MDNFFKDFENRFSPATIFMETYLSQWKANFSFTLNHYFQHLTLQALCLKSRRFGSNRWRAEGPLSTLGSRSEPPRKHLVPHSTECCMHGFIRSLVTVNAASKATSRTSSWQRTQAIRAAILFDPAPGGSRPASFLLVPHCR